MIMQRLTERKAAGEKRGQEKWTHRKDENQHGRLPGNRWSMQDCILTCSCLKGRNAGLDLYAKCGWYNASETHVKPVSVLREMELYNH